MRVPKMHTKKLLPQYFKEVENGKKPFEIRKNDCNYLVSDAILLQEWSPKTKYTGKVILKQITYVLHGGNYGLEKGYVILGLSRSVKDGR